MTTPGKWFKVEAYGFIPDGGELITDMAAQKSVSEGLAALGFAAIDDLKVSIVVDAPVRSLCPNCGRARGDDSREKCYLC